MSKFVLESARKTHDSLEDEKGRNQFLSNLSNALALRSEDKVAVGNDNDNEEKMRPKHQQQQQQQQQHCYVKDVKEEIVINDFDDK